MITEIAQIDVKSDPNTRNEVISLKHATAKDVATLLSNLVSGQTQAASRAEQSGSRTGQSGYRSATQPGNPAPPAPPSNLPAGQQFK